MSSIREPAPNGVEPSFSRKVVIERDQSQWLFTPTEMLRTPSVLEGLPVAQEVANRQKGVNFITQVGIMLKLPQLTLATASVYLHRFFMRHAMQQPNKPGLHHYSVAATALFLATKVEENCRKMRELVVACCRVAQKQPNLVVDEQNKEYWKWRDTILHNEDLLLEALCFDLQLEQPYRILFDFLQYYGVADNKVLRNTSWAFLNDSHITTMCLLHSPRIIAGAALYVGARLAGATLPDDEQGRPWWEHLELDIHEIQRACNLLCEVYQNPHLHRVGAKEAYQKEDDMASFDKTRSFLSPRTDMSPRSIRSASQGTKRDRTEAEEDQSEEWGKGQTNNVLPSPKRPRRESEEVKAPQQEPYLRVPPSAEKVPPAQASKEDFDDVQQRIDNIINASNPNSNQHSRRPSLTRRPSSQQQQHPGASAAQPSEPTHRQTPPTSNSNGRPSEQRRENREERPASRQDHQNGHRHDRDTKPGYGSEEGEL
jgi:protein BUR2